MTSTLTMSDRTPPATDRPSGALSNRSPSADYVVHRLTGIPLLDRGRMRDIDCYRSAGYVDDQYGASQLRRRR